MPKTSANDQLGSRPRTYGLTPDTVMFRYTFCEDLAETAEGELGITGNPHPSEIHVHIHQDTIAWMAKNIGPGISFSVSAVNGWKADAILCMWVTTQDIIEQGGRIYPVASSIYKGVMYVATPPEGLRVTKAE